MKENSASMVTVTGRPRTPRDQGSVENMNKHVKKAIFNIQQNYRDQNRIPNWTESLGQVMHALNSARQKGQFGGTPPYKVVLRHDPQECDQNLFSELRKCTTVHERFVLHPDGHDFGEMMKTSKFMEDFLETRKNPLSDEDSDSSYWSPHPDVDEENEAEDLSEPEDLSQAIERKEIQKVNTRNLSQAIERKEIQKANTRT
jgi:hypothetical protein